MFIGKGEITLKILNIRIRRIYNSLRKDDLSKIKILEFGYWKIKNNGAVLTGR